MEDILNKLGLPANIVRIIMNCVTSPTMQIIWNRSPSEEFTPSRGITQGCRLSPYLFALCMERLAHGINWTVVDKWWDR